MALGEKSDSVVSFVDFLNQLEWDQKFLLSAQRKEYLVWLSGVYSGSSQYLGFDFSDDDLRKGVRLFTGERLHTQLGLNYVLGLEISRQFYLLDGFSLETGEILDEVNRRLSTLCFVKDDCMVGECAECLLMFWRYLNIARWEDADRRIERYLRLLKRDRDGSGRWSHFPFYFTLYVLSETDSPLARAELSYAVQACQRSLSYISLPEPYASRRKNLISQVEAGLGQKQLNFASLGI